ncbi:hypothetical protein BDP27DRAFT_415036 [Rhodocollybia butyracea]|uniref:Uncharacterized protein n=1 Tax=Rhodocollybia butyracea TaxID=206335 RepID=A0A9P5Q0C3_9AGAR|nr:hypothetical protein BDP27DRAFT_415036 [Rhodocollybia butyracea]
MPANVANSHICPKRMGNEQAAFTYSRHTGPPAPLNLTIYDPCFGICLSKSLDTYFDVYKLGFRKFTDNWARFNIVYMTLQVKSSMTVTPPNSTSPPPGLMYWHYLQCVIRKFGHQMFRESDNIVHFEQPMPMEDDLQDEDENEGGFWPTAMLDLGSMYKEQLEEKLKKHEETASWVESSATVTLT